MERNEPPVKAGEQYELECMSIGKKGDGVFKVENFVIIVPDTQQGESYKVEVTRVLDNIAFGKVV